MKKSSDSPDPTPFDLAAYAKKVKPEVPNYEDLMREQGVAFMKFITKLRDRLRGVREGGKKVFVILGTGGTFQSAETDEGLSPTGSLRESFDALGLPEDPAVHLELCDLMNLDSSQMTIDQWRFLAKMIILVEETASDLYDAIIVTHGTDTMAKKDSPKASSSRAHRNLREKAVPMRRIKWTAAS